VYSLKTSVEIEIMRKAGYIVALVLAEMKTFVKPGVSTLELDQIAENIIRENDAIPTFKGHMGFPATLCTSVNEEVVHGIPSAEKVLQEGDIISIDCGATYQGYVGDAAITLPVGEISEEKQRLLKATEEALNAGIESSVAGTILEEVSGAIEDTCKRYKLGLVRNYGGHGVGKNMWEEPFIFNWRTGLNMLMLVSGMTICLEPMFNLGKDEVHVLRDGWTVVTNDKSPSAHFEHTIAITETGPEILTKLF
jgi:methionyl aminopeptidase